MERRGQGKERERENEERKVAGREGQYAVSEWLACWTQVQ